ncbi:MAG: AbrB/MazE/SpoVT family DNA-binding domain-containing protein [Halobacteriales archaeon]|nr:AbrB/MazE/SpoVT family DNA-binding domain-containing protein [Halobacteriales archaeon]
MSEEEDGDVSWPASMVSKQMQAGQEAMEQQMSLMKAMSGFPKPDALTGMGAFKARVQSGGRISLPEAEREALGIEEGDVVQTFVVPVKKNDRDRSDKDD